MEAIAADIRARCPSPEQIAVEVQRLAAEAVAGPERIAELELHLRAARDPEPCARPRGAASPPTKESPRRRWKRSASPSPSATPAPSSR